MSKFREKESWRVGAAKLKAITMSNRLGGSTFRVRADDTAHTVTLSYKNGSGSVDLSTDDLREIISLFEHAGLCKPGRGNMVGNDKLSSTKEMDDLQAIITKRLLKLKVLEEDSKSLYEILKHANEDIDKRIKEIL